MKRFLAVIMLLAAASLAVAQPGPPDTVIYGGPGDLPFRGGDGSLPPQPGSPVLPPATPPTPPSPAVSLPGAVTYGGPGDLPFRSGDGTLPPSSVASTPAPAPTPAPSIPAPSPAPAPSAPASGYVAFVPPVPNVIYQIDASEPASTQGPAAGTPGLQIDANSNLLGGNEAISQTPFTHGFGEVSLVTTGDPNGQPYLHGTSTSFNNAYDGIVLPAADAAQFFAQAGQSWHATFVIRPTGPNSTALLQAYNNGNNQQVVANWGSDGALRGGQNTGGGGLNEPSGPLTAFGQWEILDLYGDGQNGTTSVYRNCGLTFTSGDSNPLGGLAGTTAFEFLNNPQADVKLLLIGNGLPSQAQHQANCAALATRFHIPGAIATVSSGPTAPIAPLLPDLVAQDLRTPNFPSPAAPPTETTPSLPDGVTLAAGAVSMADYKFGTAADSNISNRAALDAAFYYNPIFGNLNNPSPTATDGQQGNTTSYSRVARYPDGSPYNLHTFNADGLSINAVCGQNNTAAGCTNGNMRGGMIRSPVPFHPGMAAMIRFRGGNSQLNWTPIWFAKGLETSPGPGGNPYASGLLQIPYCYYEIDGTDNYGRFADGILKGFVLDTDIVPQYEYAVNPGGKCYHRAPKRTYEAAGPAFAYHANAVPPYNEIKNGDDTTVGFHNLIVNWPDDGSNLIDYILDGKHYSSNYYEYTPDTYTDASGMVRLMPMHLIIGNTAVPSFLPAAATANIVPQDGGPINEGPWSIVVQEIKLIQGNVSNLAAITTDANSTTLPNYGLSDYVPPTAAIASASVAGTLNGTSFYPASVTTAAVSGGGANPLVLTAPSNGNVSVKQALVMPFNPTVAGTTALRFAYSTPGTNFVNGGMMVVGENGLTGIASFFNPEKLEGDLWSDNAGDNQQQFFPSTTEPFVVPGSDFCEETVSDGTTLSFWGAPVDAASNQCKVWTPLGSQPVAGIGANAYVGGYVDNLVATPPAAGQTSPALSIAIKAIGSTPATSPQPL